MRGTFRVFALMGFLLLPLSIWGEGSTWEDGPPIYRTYALSGWGAGSIGSHTQVDIGEGVGSTERQPQNGPAIYEAWPMDGWLLFSKLPPWLFDSFMRIMLPEDQKQEAP